MTLSADDLTYSKDASGWTHLSRASVFFIRLFCRSLFADASLLTCCVTHLSAKYFTYSKDASGWPHLFRALGLSTFVYVLDTPPYDSPEVEILQKIDSQLATQFAATFTQFAATFTQFAATYTYFPPDY